MKGLVGGLLSVGGLGPRSPGPPLNPALGESIMNNHILYCLIPQQDCW